MPHRPEDPIADDDWYELYWSLRAEAQTRIERDEEVVGAAMQPNSDREREASAEARPSIGGATTAENGAKGSSSRRQGRRSRVDLLSHEIMLVCTACGAYGRTYLFHENARQVRASGHLYQVSPLLLTNYEGLHLLEDSINLDQLSLAFSNGRIRA